MSHVLSQILLAQGGHTGGAVPFIEDSKICRKQVHPIVNTLKLLLLQPTANHQSHQFLTPSISISERVKALFNRGKHTPDAIVSC